VHCQINAAVTGSSIACVLRARVNADGRSRGILRNGAEYFATRSHASGTSQLLDTSRILKGTIHVARQPVDLVVVTQEALDAVRPPADARKVQMAFDATPCQRTVTGDAGRLQQVIWNLLANAIKFTPQGGQVRASVESSHDHVEVTVADTGEGISPDFLPHVFERFRQGEGATTARHTGLGLGLGIVRQLVDLHGGTVHAASPGLGHGATFTVRLPIPAGDAQERESVAM
jgi:signal transduction histidine kinase